MTPPPQQHTNSFTLGQWIQQWIDIYAPTTCKSGVTLERYQRLANYLLEGSTRELGDLSTRSLDQLTHPEIEYALLTLMRAPAKRRKHLSVRSVRHVAGVISSALGKAARAGLIAANVMANVELPSAERPEVRALSIDEIARLRQVCRGDWTRLFVELALAAGLRRGELLALTLGDINHTTRVLSVTKSLEETSQGLRIKHTKNGCSRRCTLPRTVMLLLSPCNCKTNLTSLLFPDESGRWRRPVLVSQTIARRMRQAGIGNASLHSLRHTHASQLLSRGMPLPAVSARLGHSDPAFTLRIYGHALPPDDARLAEEWDRILSTL